MGTRHNVFILFRSNMGQTKKGDKLLFVAMLILERERGVNNWVQIACPDPKVVCMCCYIIFQKHMWVQIEFPDPKIVCMWCYSLFPKTHLGPNCVSRPKNCF